MAEPTTTIHPGDVLLQDPLGEETRRNRTALLAIALVCIAVRITGAFPQQISALGITFSSSDQRKLIWLAIGLQVYLLAVFSISASADMLRWRRNLRLKIREYVENNRLREFTVDSAVDAAVDELAGKHIRAEAPSARMNHEFVKYVDGKRGFYRMLFINSPVAWVHHALLLYLPAALCLWSVGALALWVPAANGVKAAVIVAATNAAARGPTPAFIWPDPISLIADVITFLGVPILVFSALKLRRDLHRDRLADAEQILTESHRQAVSQGCIEFYDTRQRLGVNLVPFEKMTSVPQPGDFVMLPGETRNGITLGAGEYEVEKISSSFQEAPEITDQPCPAVPSKIIVYVHKRGT